MARQRFIWPDFWEDPELGQLEPVVQLFFIGCFSNADDEGRLLGNPSYLRATIFPYLDFSLAGVTEIRDAAVAGCENLELYEVDATPYLAFNKWSDYQKPKYPKASKLPAPPSQKTRKRGKKAFGKDSEALGEASVKASTTGRDGLGRVVNPPAPLSKGGEKTGRKSLRRYTGCRQTKGSHGVGYERDPLGVDKPPPDWPHPRPTAEEVQTALGTSNGDMLKDDPQRFVELAGWKLKEDELEQMLSVYVPDEDERIRLVDLAADLRREVTA